MREGDLLRFGRLFVFGDSLIVACHGIAVQRGIPRRHVPQLPALGVGALSAVTPAATPTTQFQDLFHQIHNQRTRAVDREGNGNDAEGSERGLVET